ncbi:MAG: patatin-like phospholipase family protein [Candidatus Binatia bacterium]
MRTRRVGRESGRTLGLALSGGGARGAFQVGVYERLLRDPRFAGGPTVLSGTSAGAINAALIAAGRTPREMMRFWNGIADDPPVVVSPKFFRTLVESFVRLSIAEAGRWLTPRRALVPFLRRARNHLPPRPGSLMAVWVEYLLTSRFEVVSHLLEGIREPFVADTSRLRERLVKEFRGEVVPNNGHRLAINTVDAHTGQVVRYVTARTRLTKPPDYIVVEAITVDMILASASIPLLFPTVEIDGRWLWDGGVLVNTPLAPVVALGADEIVTVLVTEPPDIVTGPFPHFGRAVERTVDAILENAYNVDRKLLLDRNRLAHLERSPYREVTLYEAVRPARDGSFNAGSYLYFERSVLADMRAAGRRAATAWLATGPRVDELETHVAGKAA